MTTAINESTTNLSRFVKLALAGDRLHHGGDCEGEQGDHFKFTDAETEEVLSALRAPASL